MNFRLARKPFLLILNLVLSVSVLSQKKDSTWVGAISGSVRDSARNFYLQSATISVYGALDNALLSYSLTNSLGEFHINNLPINSQLKLSISYIGYQTYSRSFSIILGHNPLSLGKIDLKASYTDIDTVLVNPPPVSMHGDTLEFNSAAFKMDKNAVVEDLIRNLPGAVVWGDGTITINGRQISKLLVEGKPFFGGNAKVATRNIPKGAVDKIQVYQEAIDPNNPLDSITSINIKLRKGAKTGYFGALSAGSGTNHQYEAGLTQSFFSPRNELGVYFQSNNVNKVADNINTILNNSTYKGINAYVEYQPDFNIPGSYQQTSGGLLFSHDFIPEFNQYKQDRISTNSFYNYKTNNTTSDVQTTSSLGSDSSLRQDNEKNSIQNTSKFNFDTRYNKRKGNDSFYVVAKVNLGEDKLQTIQQNQSYDPESQLLSYDNQDDSSKNHSQQYSIQGSYIHHGFDLPGSNKITNWGLTYDATWGINNLNRLFKANFIHNSDSSLDLFFDRKYYNQLNELNQVLAFQIGDFSAWLFGDNRILSKYHIFLGNEIRFNTQGQNNSIEDRDTATNKYLGNTYLTKQGNNKVLDELPDLRIGKTFWKLLANRYQKELNINVDLKGQFRQEDNSSSHSFQNYTKSSGKFIPMASLSYSNFQYGDYLNRFNLNFGISYNYPTPEQLVPLVDSANIYFVHKGNSALSPSRKYELSFQFRHDAYRSKNTFFYGASALGGISDNFIGDSVLVDLAGRYIYYPVNINGNRYLRLSGFLNKAINFSPSQLQFIAGASVQLSRNPGYIGYQSLSQSGVNISNVFSNSDSVSLYYTFKDMLAINLSEKVSYYKSMQSGFSSNEFTSIQTLSSLGVGLNVTKRLSVNTNISYNRTTYSKSNPIGFKIWNASATYRFLKANNLELKLSALDLLNQNKGIISSGNNSSFTFGTVNTLRQYFMATITYFPRKFGKNGNPK